MKNKNLISKEDKKMKNDTPYIDKALMDYLKRLFPEREITPESSMQEMYFWAGVAKVITTLETLMAKQEKRK